jgi:hypothetical protein
MLVDEIWVWKNENARIYSLNGVLYFVDTELEDEQVGCDYCGGIHQSGSCR